jgi:hypothetical protein
MKRMSWRIVALGLVLLAAAAQAPAAPAPAQKSPLAQLPASAPIVVHVRGVEGARDRLIDLMKKALPDLVPMVQPKLDEWLKEGFDGGRKIRGLAKDGPLFLVFTEMPKDNQNPQRVALLLKTTKYEEFRDNILKEEERKNLSKDGKGIEHTSIGDEPIYMFDLSGWAVVTPSKEVAELFTQRPRVSLDTRIGKPLADKLLAADLGAYLALDIFNKEYAEQLKEARENVARQIKEAADRGELQGAAGMGPLIEKAIDTFFQAIEDSQGIVATLELRKGGLALHAQTELREGSPTARMLKSSQASSFEQLGQLPAGRQSYTAFQSSPALARALGGLLLGVLADPASKDSKPIRDAVDRLIKAGPTQIMEASGIPPEGLQVWTFENAAEAVDAHLKLVESLPGGSTFQSGIVKKSPTVKKNAEKAGDMAMHRVEVSWDLEKLAEKSSGGKELSDEAKKQVMEGLRQLRGDRLTYWVGTDGKVVYQAVAKSWDRAEVLLQQYKKGGKAVGDDVPFQNIRKELPRRCSYLSVVDIVKYLIPLYQIAKPSLAALPIPFPPTYPIPPKEGAVGYIGSAATLESRAISLDLFISAESINEVYKAFAKPFIPDNTN